MPRIKTIERTVFAFDELSESAKETARESYRNDMSGDFDSSFIYEDAERIADILGVRFKTRSVRLMGGSTVGEPCIWWSGFASQGDGACFEGFYNYAKACSKRIRAYAPQDEKLHSIADRLTAIQRRNCYQLEAGITHRGHYNHEYCTDIQVRRDHWADMTDDAEETVKECMRDFMRWIYRQLELEYEFQMSDSVVDESLDGLNFDEDGNVI